MVILGETVTTVAHSYCLFRLVMACPIRGYQSSKRIRHAAHKFHNPQQAGETYLAQRDSRADSKYHNQD